MPLNVATQVAGIMLHYATNEKFVAALQGALRRMQLICTYRNDGSNKNVARNVCGNVCCTEQFFLQLVLHEKICSVT